MNHYVKIAAAVAGGVLGAKIVEAGVKRVAGAISNAAARIAASDNNEANDAPNAEQPKPEKPAEKKAPEKKDGQGKKDDKKPADGKQDNNGKKGDKKPEAAGKK